MPGRFQVAANALITRKDGKLLILKRKPDYDHDPDRWDTVSGRLEQDIENVRDELKREISEELGNDFCCVIVAPFSTYNFYRGEDRKCEVIGVDYICMYYSGNIELSEEHTDYRWVKPEDFLKMDISGSLKRAVRIFIRVKDWYIANVGLFIDEVL
ncbi:MAG: NUDIX domain-containing protein [Patescibacteria group bacterium]|nr:NUDIX domain-containing protein [Patescibacteria group bacterium]